MIYIRADFNPHRSKTKMSNNARSNYLVYNNWTTIGSHGGVIAGSHLLDLLVMTEEEAQSAVAAAEAQHKKFITDYHFLYKPTNTNRFCYIVNKPEWWSKHSDV